MAPDRARARPDGRARRGGRVRRLGPTNPDDFELPSYAEYYEWAIVPLALFAAVVAPLLLCPDRSDGVLSLYAARPITPLDYVGARWAAFFTVAARGGWAPEAVLFTWNVLDAEHPGSWLRDNWDVVPRFLARGRPRRRRAHDARAVRRVVHDAPRLRVRSATLAVLFIGSAIGGIAEDNFSGGARGRALARRPAAGADRHRALDLRRRASTGRCRAACARSGSLGLTVVLAAWLLRRTNRLVRG